MRPGDELMDQGRSPEDSAPDDHRYSQRIAILVRWFLLAAWFGLHNYRPDFHAGYYTNSSLALMLAVLNGYVHWRLWKGRPVTQGYASALSVMDLTFITAGIATSSGFHNTFFVLYYPALVGMSLVFHTRRYGFIGVTVVALAYALTSALVDRGLDLDAFDEKVLAIRIASMYAVVAAANLMTRSERERRIEAVEAERIRARENLDLQRKAEEAEVAALEERGRIGREIHDGIAQSIYALSLNLEMLADVAERGDGEVRERMKVLVPLAKHTAMETRFYINDLKPMLIGEATLSEVVDSQAKEFRAVSGLPVELSVHGDSSNTSAMAGHAVQRVLREALFNVYKHAKASSVAVTLAFDNGSVKLSVQDDGRIQRRTR